MPSSKCFGAVVALALFVLPFAAPAAPTTAARNLVVNPGFETGLSGHEWMPAGWDTSDAGLPTVFFGRDTLSPRSGHYSVNIANTSNVWMFNHNWHQAVLVGRETWGKDAIFSIWTRSSGVDGHGYVLAQCYQDTVTRMAKIWGVDRDEALRRMMINNISDPQRELTWKRLYFPEVTTGWVRREVRLNVPAGTNVIFVRAGLIGTGQVAFDDASLTLVPAAPAPQYPLHANILKDPGFEEGALTWEWTVPPFEGAKITIDSTTSHGGHASMLCSDMFEGYAPARMGMVQVIDARSLRGKHLRASAWFRADSLELTAFSKVYCSTLHGMEQSGAGELLSGTFDWTQNSTEFDVPKDATEIWAWFMLNSPCKGRMWIDDASVEVLGPAGESASASSGPPSKHH